MKRISSEDRLKTSHLAEQASVEQGSEKRDCQRRGGLRVTGKAETRSATSGPVKTRLQQRWNTENMRLRARQECPAWTWTNRRNDRPIEEPNQRQMGEWETIPSGGHSRVPKSGGPQVWAA